MVKSTILGRNSISGRAGSGIVIRRELNAIRNRIDRSLSKRQNPLGYLQSIQNKGAFSQTNSVVNRLIQLYSNNPNLRKGSIRRNFQGLTSNVISSGLQVASEKTKASKRNIARASARNVAKGIKQRARVTGFTKAGVKYRVGAQGGFERVGFTQDEQARRNRIRTGTATASDLFKGQNQRTLQGQINIHNRLLPGLSRLERIESQLKIMKKAGLPRATFPKDEPKPTAMLVPATRTEKAQMALGRVSQKREELIAKKGTFAPLMGTLGVPLGFVKGLSEAGTALLRPKQTVTNLKDFVKTFFKAPLTTTVSVGRGVSQSFITDPALFIGEYYAFGKITNKLISGTRRSFFGRYLQKELFLAQQPVQLRGQMRKILDAVEAQRLINPVPKSSLKKVRFFDVKELNKIDAKALSIALRKTDSVVFGSKASRVLSKGKTKIPKDVDLATRDVDKFNKAFLDAVPRKLRKTYTIKKEKILRNGSAILDVKPIGRLIPDRSLLTRTGFIPVSGYVTRLSRKKGSILPRLSRKPFQTAFEVKTSPLVKISGIKLTGFGEQTLRKALGTLQVLVEKNARRAKDPSALLEALEIQLKALKASNKIGKASKIKKLTEAIKLLKSKEFQKLLESKVPGLTKEFPLVTKLKKATHSKFLKDLKKKRISSKKAIKSKSVSKKATVKKKPSAKKRSSIHKKRTSKVPSRVPSRLRSRVPSRTPSRVPSRLSSKVPSRTPSKLSSKVPSRTPSRVPSRLGSKVPSRTPSKLSSKVPSRVPSRLSSKVPSRVPSRTPISKRSPKRPVKPVKPIKPFSLKEKTPFKDAGKKARGFDSWIFANKKWRKANRKPLTKPEADKLARYVTEHSISASYVVVGTLKKAVKSKVKLSAPKKNFRATKSKTRPKGTRVERSKARINTRGEKRKLRIASVIARARKSVGPAKRRKVKRRTKKAKK